MKIIKPVLLLLMIFFGSQAQAQENNRKDQRDAERYLQEAEDALEENDFASAEASYRKAIAKDPDNPTAKYNLGNLYYNKEKPAEAVKRFDQAAEIAKSKERKHKAFHNLGNSFMRQEKYKEAVDAYKDALRNNPSDEETRYNLALAKKMLEEEQQQQDDGEGGDNQDQEQEEDEEQEEDQKNQGGDGENEQESDDEGEQEEKKDEGDKQEDENEDEGDQEKEQDEGGDEQEQPQPKPQPQQGKLSPEQIKSLLEAMNNEERKVQDKINAEKAKGAKVKTDKDW
ncbi:MAG TPA: tetratricopeptide repeat protein [Salegentibacter sp.]|uniref:tetratricopeptide repeat protein n=1 Tax=Salegentibacter sp. TaxID=1903072 RepID=UPI002F94D7BD